MFPNAEQKGKERKEEWGERQLQNQHMTAGKWIDMTTQCVSLPRLIF